jgi:3D (Asp-Asp-Asp) domain-containing protein
MKIILLTLYFVLFWVTPLDGHYIETPEETIVEVSEVKQQKYIEIEVMTTAYTVNDGYTPGVIMANGEKVHEGAVGYNDVPLGTLLEIDGEIYVVKDRVAEDGIVDIYMNNYNKCMEYGVQRKVIKIIKGETND